MPNRMHHHVETSGDTATLHLAGFIEADSAPALIDVCGRLPASICTLRVDLSAIGSLSADALGAVRGLLHHWRTTRQGEFRLTTSYLQATCQPVERRLERSGHSPVPSSLHEHPWQVRHPEWVPSFRSARTAHGPDGARPHARSR